MPEMEIVPYERFGPVRFGATKEQVIEAIGQPDTVTRSGLQLNYRQLGIHVMIDEDANCESVESVDPSVCVPIVDGDLRLVGRVDRLVESLRQRGFHPREDPESDFVCDELGVVFGSEFGRQEVESVCAFRQDAYQLMTEME